MKKYEITGKKNLMAVRGGDKGEGNHVRIAFHNRGTQWKGVELDLKKGEAQWVSLHSPQEANSWIDAVPARGAETSI